MSSGQTKPLIRHGKEAENDNCCFTCCGCLTSCFTRESESWDFSKVPRGTEWPTLWNTSPFIPSRTGFICAKTVLFLYMVFSTLESLYAWNQSGDLAYWPIYLTHWTLMALTTYQFFSLITLILLNENTSELSEIPNYAKAEWALRNVCLGAVPIVVIMYWATVYSPPVNFFPSINIHLVNLLVLAIDLAISWTPIYSKHFWQPLVYSTTYIVFSIMYDLCGGVNENGGGYIYSVLDWDGKTELASQITFVSCIILAPVIFLLLATYNCCMDRIGSAIADSHHEQSELIIKRNDKSISNMAARVIDIKKESK